jgi:hypothetical protein
MYYLLLAIIFQAHQKQNKRRVIVHHMKDDTRIE